ncbi:MAG TPA: RNA-binding protein [Bryobacteraceae bacterium]|nr:RNA-binding protein [Bryobacteraceae bacterium]
MKLFVGNLSFQTTEQDLLTLFFEYGTVETVNVVTDRDTGQPRGFAFVEMPNRAEAEAAIKSLDGRELGGRNLNVSEARPKPDGGRPGGGGGGFKKSFSGGGGGGRNKRY